MASRKNLTADFLPGTPISSCMKSGDRDLYGDFHHLDSPVATSASSECESPTRFTPSPSRERLGFFRRIERRSLLEDSKSRRRLTTTRTDTPQRRTGRVSSGKSANPHSRSPLISRFLRSPTSENFSLKDVDPSGYLAYWIG